MRAPAPPGRPEPGGSVLQAVDGNNTPRPRLRCMVSPPAGGRPGVGAGPKPSSAGSADAAATPSPRRTPSARASAHVLGGASAPDGGAGAGRAAALCTAQRALAARLAGDGRVRGSCGPGTCRFFP